MRNLLKGIVAAVIVLTGFGPETASGQEAAHHVYVEGLGAAGLYSLNYERALGGGIHARVGASYLPKSTEWTAQLLVPVSASYVHSFGRHALELGAGVTGQLLGNRRVVNPPVVAKDWSAGGITYLLHYIAGYRFTPAATGLSYRIAFTPLHSRNEGWISHAGVGIGYRF